MDGSITAERYQKMLEERLLPFIDEHSQRTAFQHNGAPPHTAVSTKEWLAARDIETIQWPSRSPDLNMIENQWSELACKVYENGRQLDDIADVKQTIEEAWKNLWFNYIRFLVHSIPSRCLRTVEKRGGYSGY